MTVMLLSPDDREGARRARPGQQGVAPSSPGRAKESRASPFINNSVKSDDKPRVVLVFLRGSIISELTLLIRGRQLEAF
jgi:hypothetical protein